MSVASDHSNLLISADELRERLRQDPPPILLDVRWKLGGPDGADEYARGHLPDAVFVDLERELSGPVTPDSGRHPLPDVADLEATLRRAGVRTDSDVVVYDDWGGMSAARAWWLLRWGGMTAVRVLDGGLSAWRAVGGDVTADVPSPEPGDVVLTPGSMLTVAADQAAELARTGVLLDARAGERYRGESEPVDPVAGHIPGAVNAPTTENTTAEGRFRVPDELRERFAALGVDPSTPVGVYCGSGVTAAHEVLALATVGIEAALYPGSWSEWIRDPSRPVETG
ncbi:sulfurtransferase [Phytoactinopolyspora halotolerans]|uniref:Sulfurtransferase n=1 Tax=Phytoactinopolyspora halotolerans TaxID=1981512 RepID=A0A6L9SET4_9ACTN|nr:sulfurtransferase [Phytoactinopolyspora halotolerans]NEE03597.1 sulfurtransferase [Phytoactinopolyspora halotolerans]